MTVPFISGMLSAPAMAGASRVNQYLRNRFIPQDNTATRAYDEDVRRESTYSSLRPERVEEGTPESIRRAFMTPTADTLYRTFGIPSVMGGRSADDGFGGMYSNWDNSVRIADRVGRNSENFNHTLAHELGHLADYQRNTIDQHGNWWYPSVEEGGGDIRAGRRSMTPYDSAVARIDHYPREADYYGMNKRKEAYASASANAALLLRKSVNLSWDETKALAGQLEANTPGMGRIVSVLATAPIWNGHPHRNLFINDKQHRITQPLAGMLRPQGDSLGLSLTRTRKSTRTQP